MIRAGEIKFFNAERGFGFIKPDDGAADVFVHVTQVRSGAELVEGDRVTFEDGVSERNNKPQAVRVKLDD
jgi:CspA family cold shock protein